MVASHSLASIDMTERDAGMLAALPPASRTVRGVPSRSGSES